MVTLILARSLINSMNKQNELKIRIDPKKLLARSPSYIIKMISLCEELGEHDTPFCTCRDGNLNDLEERVKARRIRNAKRDSKL